MGEFFFGEHKELEEIREYFGGNAVLMIIIEDNNFAQVQKSGKKILLDFGLHLRIYALDIK